MAKTLILTNNQNHEDIISQYMAQHYSSNETVLDNTSSPATLFDFLDYGNYSIVVVDDYFVPFVTGWKNVIGDERISKLLARLSIFCSANNPILNDELMRFCENDAKSIVRLPVSNMASVLTLD